MITHVVLPLSIGILIMTFFTLAACQAYSSFPSIIIQGNKFFNSSDGVQFFIMGIAYQPQVPTDSILTEIESLPEHNYIDPLADPLLCLRDIPYLKELHVNTIRVYSIDPKKDHDICMNALMDAGIYVVSDLSEPSTSIVRDNPTWNTNLFKRYTDVVDALHKYPNVLGFFAGNEVTNDITNTGASPFVKAAIRDTKEYIHQQGYRSIPVGYSSNDDLETRDYLDQYFTCGDFIADFYGVNMYEWCGYSTYQTSGYRERTEHFRDFPIPLFFSEFGCNLVQPRPFSEVKTLFGNQMTEVWSGGLAYMYFEESNHYGIVSIDPVTDEVVKLPDFNNLSNGFKTATPKRVIINKTMDIPTGGSIVQNRDCPFNESNWNVSNELPPTPDSEICQCTQVLPCLAVADSSNQNFQDFFDNICNEVDCSDISADGNDGTFGKYSFCTTNEKVAIVASKWYFNGTLSGEKCPLTGQFTGNNKDYSPHPRKLSLMCDIFETNVKFSNKRLPYPNIYLGNTLTLGNQPDSIAVGDTLPGTEQYIVVVPIDHEVSADNTNGYGRTTYVKKLSLFISVLLVCTFF